MNTNWLDFLVSQSGIIADSGEVVFSNVANNSGKNIYPLTNLSVLTFSGTDAAKFLQGQITCNVNDIVENKSSLGAMCNPKGRVVTTFLLLKKANHFLMILPVELAEVVQRKLQMYVLRSDVNIENSKDEFCLLGLTGLNKTDLPDFFTQQHNEVIEINLPGIVHRKIMIATPENAIRIWSELTKRQDCQENSTEAWRYLDIVTGMPWLTMATSEEFIPQMLNVDKLGGISFTKGCYTGQEVVARTHYLGKVKREMLLAECSAKETPAPKSPIIVSVNSVEQVVGLVLQAQLVNNSCKLLIIIQVNDIDHNALKLKDYNHPALHIIPFAS